MSKYFNPADFSDFETFIEETPIKTNPCIEVPTPEKLRLIEERISVEFKKCYSGTSKLMNRTIQPSTTGPSGTALSSLLRDFTEQNALIFVDMVKQDYGFTVAEWVAMDVLSPYVPSVLNRVSRR